MKYFWIFSLVFTSMILHLQKVVAQTDTLLMHQAYSIFSNSEKAEWTSFENNWNFFEYTKIKNELKTPKLSCRKCNSLYADLYVEVDSTGKFSVIRFLKGKNCGIWDQQESFVELFEHSLKKQKFTYIKDRKFIVRLGHILKC